jgi:hypothetical protein
MRSLSSSVKTALANSLLTVTCGVTIDQVVRLLRDVVAKSEEWDLDGMSDEDAILRSRPAFVVVSDEPRRY